MDDEENRPGTGRPHGPGRAVDLTPSRPGSTGGSDTPGAEESHGTGHDPLRLCIFATVSLLSWLGGPWALAFFAALGVVGYARARRAGLLRSRCLLGDTRVVLAYLSLLLVVAGWAAWRQLTG